jgi:hypothetical protein
MIPVVIDNMYGTGPIALGTRGFIAIPFDGTVTQWSAFTDVTVATTAFDVHFWSNQPGFATSVCSATVAIGNQYANGPCSVSITANDVLKFEIISNTNISLAGVTLVYQRT